LTIKVFNSMLDVKAQNIAPAEESHAKIRIKLKAYDSKIIDEACRIIISAVEREEVKVVGPIPLPIRIKKYTVLRSTFVHKDSREQYEMRIHKRLIDLIDPTPKITEVLINLNLPNGLDIEIKM